MTEIDELLSEIQTAVGCYFLSDLHQIHRLYDVESQDRIMSIPLKKYSLSVWNAAASYIIGSNCCFATADEARASIGGR